MEQFKMHLIDQELNLMIRGRFDEGWKVAEKLEELDPDDPRAKFNRGWFLINQGNLQEGFQCLEYGRSLNVYGSGKLGTTRPIWNPEIHEIKNKTVIINLEGGFGDQIMYARFATVVRQKGGIPILCCTKLLHSVFNRIPGLEKCITESEVKSTHHDYWIPSFSCSWLFGHTFETLPNDPYIFADQKKIEEWKDFLSGFNKCKIGIRWSGSPKFEHQQFRIFPPELLINLSHEHDNLQFLSLQRDTDLRELPNNILDLEKNLATWEDTVACIENLDLVITSCTSIAHISGAMNKPTWVIVPLLPYHVWAYGDDHSPWYPKNTRVFRQQSFGKWEETFQNISLELKKFFAEK